MNDRSTKVKRLLILFFGVVIGITAGLFIWGSFNNPKQYDPRDPKERETGGAPTLIVLNSSEELAKVLLPTQFDATKAELDNYVKNNISSQIKEVSLSQVQRPNDGGVITFRVRIDSPVRDSFTVSIDRWTQYDKIIFSIPEKNYQSELQVYEG